MTEIQIGKWKFTPGVYNDDHVITFEDNELRFPQHELDQLYFLLETIRRSQEK